MATFGNTTNAGNSDWLNANQVIGTTFTSPADAGTLTTLSLYVNNASTPFNVKLVVYTPSGTFLATSADTTLSATGFQSVPISLVLSPSTSYTLCVLYKAAGSSSGSYDFAATGSSLTAGSVTYASPGNVSFGSVGSYSLTIFATYTPASVTTNSGFFFAAAR